MQKISEDRVVVLEFNELVPELLERFIDEGQLPNFKRLRDESIVAVTDAGEDPPNLEPWIQWVTVHSGLPFADHRCFNLNDGAALKAPRIWDVVSDAGRKVWVCGSMNAGVQGNAINGHVLPDPWATAVMAQPEGFFDPYNRLVRAFVHEHSSGAANVGIAEVLNFGRFMVANGLSAETVWGVLRQLISERRDNTRWRRPVILDRMTWDLFRSLWRTSRPALSTFFLNSTAHFQHFYWREFEPDRFTVRPSPERERTYAQTVAFGYRQMDRIVGEMLDMAGDDVSVVLISALSQKPMLHFEEAGGRQIFRHRDHGALMRWAGVGQAYAYEPIMSQQFTMTFSNEADAIAAAAKIQAIRMAADGAQVMLARRNGVQVMTGCMIDSPPAHDALVTCDAGGAPLLFHDAFYPLESLRSGMHHPDGVFWARTPARHHAVIGRTVSLTELAPTLVAMAGVDAAKAFAHPPLPEVLAALADRPRLAAVG
eukprot:gene11229-11313_t